MKQRIRLTEGQLVRLVKKSAKKMLKEAQMTIKEQELENLIQTINDNRGDKLSWEKTGEDEYGVEIYTVIDKNGSKFAEADIYEVIEQLKDCYWDYVEDIYAGEYIYYSLKQGNFSELNKDDLVVLITWMNGQGFSSDEIVDMAMRFIGNTNFEYDNPHIPH